MFHNYPQLFNPANRANLRVVAEDGRVVSHAGMTQRWASLAGCTVSVACVGGVATEEAYRGRGFAALVFQDCCAKAAADGVDIMLISGRRTLYTRVGCSSVGDDWQIGIDAAGARSLAGSLRANGLPDGGAYDITPVNAGHIGDLQAVHRLEAVRFLRPLDDWQWAFQTSVVMNAHSDFWGVYARTGSELLAYVITHRPVGAIVRVVEFAGERHAVAAVLPFLLDHYRAERLSIHIQRHDVALRRLIAAAGLRVVPAAAAGTLRIINFPQLIARCRPLLAERLGMEATATVMAKAEAPAGSPAGGFALRVAGETLHFAGLTTLVEWLFGTPSPNGPPPSGPAHLATHMHNVFPALWLGVNLT
jgi:predicted acetyltransferase